ncbi:MAG: TlpA disulfide reductase family protein [Mariprofundus sp.]|nr:TlpA disulfide reductase family protein [Mariprofundus sp.]
MTLRWLFILLIMAGIGTIVWQSLPEPPAIVDVGSSRIEFALPDLQGKGQTLPQGELILLNFWATWCPPCRREIPSMVALDKHFAGRGLNIVAVSVDKRLDDLAGFVKEYHMPFQVLHDANTAVSSLYGVFRYPESFLIDRQGVIKHHYIGEVDWMSAPVRQTIEAMLPPIVAKGAIAPSVGG